jgi:hypothetical protein
MRNWPSVARTEAVRLAKWIGDPEKDMAANTQQITELVKFSEAAPLLEVKGFCAITAATCLTVWSHQGRVTSFLDATGFALLCGERFSQFVPERASHRPGRIIGSLADTFAGDGKHASDLDVLRNSPGRFGPVSSNATVSRFALKLLRQPIRGKLRNQRPVTSQ